MPKKIIFVRHGETPYNVQKRLMNWQSDVGLSEKGKSEADLLGKKLKSYDIDIIYASDLRRTVETAEIINQNLNKKFIKTKQLRERSLGIFGELTFEEIKNKWPDKLEKFLDHADKNWNGLEGESLNDVVERFSTFLRTLEENHPNETILLVTHSGILYTVLRDIFEFLPQNTWLDVGHTSITILERSGESYALAQFNKE